MLGVEYTQGLYMHTMIHVYDNIEVSNGQTLLLFYNRTSVQNVQCVNCIFA